MKMIVRNYLDLKVLSGIFVNLRGIYFKLHQIQTLKTFKVCIICGYKFARCILLNRKDVLLQ